MLSEPHAQARLGRRFNMGFVTDTFFGGSEKKAGEKAAEASIRAGELGAEASREAAQLQQQRFEDIKGLATPFIQPGAGALGLQSAFSGAAGPEAQAQAFGQFQESPGVQFLREQGLREFEAGQGAVGGLGGGQRLRELTRFSQGLALQDFGNQFNRLGAVTGASLGALGGLGGVSTAATTGQAQALQSAGAQLGTGVLGAGQAQAAGLLGQQQGLIGGLSGLAGAAGESGLFKNVPIVGQFL